MPYEVEIVIHHDVIRDSAHLGVSSGLLGETTALLQNTIFDVQRRWLENLRQEPSIAAAIKEQTHSFNFLSNPIILTFEEFKQGSVVAKLFGGALLGLTAFGGLAAQDAVQETELYKTVKEYGIKSLDSYTTDFRKTLQKQIDELNAKDDSLGKYKIDLHDEIIKVSVNPKQMKHIQSLKNLRKLAA